MQHWLTSYTKHTNSVSFILWFTVFPQWGTDLLKMLPFIQGFRDHTNRQSQQQLFWFVVEITTVSAWDTTVTSTVKAKKIFKKQKDKGHCWQVGTLSWWLLSQVQGCCPRAISQPSLCSRWNSHLRWPEPEMQSLPYLLLSKQPG